MYESKENSNLKYEIPIYFKNIIKFSILFFWFFWFAVGISSIFYGKFFNFKLYGIDIPLIFVIFLSVLRMYFVKNDFKFLWILYIDNIGKVILHCMFSHAIFVVFINLIRTE